MLLDFRNQGDDIGGDQRGIWADIGVWARSRVVHRCDYEMLKKARDVYVFNLTEL